MLILVVFLLTVISAWGVLQVFFTELYETQGALSAEVKNAQKKDNVQICRISVPEHADVDGLLAAMEGFFTEKYGARA